MAWITQLRKLVANSKNSPIVLHNLVFATQGVSNFYWKAILSAIMRSLHP